MDTNWFSPDSNWHAPVSNKKKKCLLQFLLSGVHQRIISKKNMYKEVKTKYL